MLESSASDHKVIHNELRRLVIILWASINHPLPLTVTVHIIFVLIDCIDGDVRLVDENNSMSVVGRVEYCIGGAWGTVCNYEWSEYDAAVVCRQLGLDAIAGNLIETVTHYTLITEYS